MSKKKKLLERLETLPKDFTFNEHCTLMGLLDFEMSNKGRTGGSRVIFFNDDICIRLHKPHPGNELKTYQVKQVFEFLKDNGFYD